MVKVKYIGDAPADTLIGRVQPGDIREVKKEIADRIVGHFFELVKEVQKFIINLIFQSINYRFLIISKIFIIFFLNFAN